MKLAELTESHIKQFAGSTIFERGYGYYRDEMVTSLTYNPDDERITAEVRGNYGDYEVVVWITQDQLKASCECPYEGYPCKHIVAALLTYSKDNGRYASQAQQQKAEWTSVEKALNTLSKEELLSLVLSCATKYADFNRELTVRFQPNQKAAFKTLRQEINRAFPSEMSRYYNTEKIAADLDRIMQSVHNASDSLKVEVNWAIADGILQELNNYGMDDDNLEEVLYEAIENLDDVLVGDDTLRSQKQKIIGELMDYYNWGNSGLVDYLYESVMDLCSDNSDYRIVIAKLKAKSKTSSYHQEQLASLYEKVGDTEAQRQTLESNLAYGMDYWRLAQYWLEKGDPEKAHAVVLTGIDKGEGRKEELYKFLQDIYEKQGDYAGLRNLLTEKISRKDVYHSELRNDPIYQSLQKYYQNRKDYQGQVDMLELRLHPNGIDLNLYKEAQNLLTSQEWPDFEKKLLSPLEQIIKKEKKGQSWGISRAREQLAEIYAYKDDLNNLYVLVKDSEALLIKHEAKLLTHHPDIYLKNYLKQVNALINLRGRGNYQSAVHYMRSIRKIYEEILEQKEKWSQYLNGLKIQHKTLRALQEEMDKL